jgi:hypothetical protein
MLREGHLLETHHSAGGFGGECFEVHSVSALTRGLGRTKEFQVLLADPGLKNQYAVFRILSQLLSRLDFSQSQNFADNVLRAHGIDKYKYPKTTSWVQVQLLRFLQAIRALRLPDFSVNIEILKNLRVLDLACGSTEISEFTGNENADERRMYEPWLCRMLSGMGLKVTGVDWRYPHYKDDVLDNKNGIAEPEWTFIRRDLTKRNALDKKTFPSGSADVVHCSRFMLGDQAGKDAKPMRDLRPSAGGGFGFQFGPVFEEYQPKHHAEIATFPVPYERVAGYLVKRVANILTEGGSFILNDTLYRKREGILQFAGHLIPRDVSTIRSVYKLQDLSGAGKPLGG